MPVFKGETGSIATFVQCQGNKLMEFKESTTVNAKGVTEIECYIESTPNEKFQIIVQHNGSRLDRAIDVYLSNEMEEADAENCIEGLRWQATVEGSEIKVGKSWTIFPFQFKEIETEGMKR